MKKLKRNNCATCTISIFGKTIYCYLTKEDFNNQMRWFGAKEYDLEENTGVFNWLLHNNGCRTYHIGVFAKDLGVLVHEIAHCSRQILKDAGIDCNSDCGNETQAYLSQFIFDEFNGFVNDL